MAAASALSQRGVGQTGNNPSVGCIIVKDNIPIARGWTQKDGRPHAEAMALSQIGGNLPQGATLYVTLEPCAHQSERGPACFELLMEAQPARICIGATDPDPRTNGKSIDRLRNAGIAVDIVEPPKCPLSLSPMAGFFMRQQQGRPFVTLKLAMSLDGKIAMPDGSSRWITGAAARAHCHLERARHDAILVGAGTVRADDPSLDVRLPGLEERSPQRVMLGSGDAPQGWSAISSPEQIASLEANSLFIEGGAMTASSFLKAGLVDRLLLYRAPIIIGQGKSCLEDIGLAQLSDAHEQWTLAGRRMLGKDQMEVYNRQE